MIVQTYQSKLVLRILKAGEIYRAKPNLSLRGEYDALIDMLGLKCECPIFAVIKGRRQNTGGKVSGSVRLTLDGAGQVYSFDGIRRVGRLPLCLSVY